jgi:hypothetical protein
MSVGLTELKAEVPAVPAPEQKLSVGLTELKAELPAVPAPEQKLIGQPEVAL